MLDNNELMSLLTPMLRPTSPSARPYVYRPEPPLDCPLLIVGGESDAIAPPGRLAPWKEQTTGPFESVILPAGHFFPQTHQPLLLETLRRALARTLGEEAVAWHTSDALPALGENEVQVFRFRLDATPEETARLEQLLDPSERERAGRFCFPADRDRYIVGRGTLALVAGTEGGTAQPARRIGYEAAGKPRLLDHQLHFNLAHSGGLALMAWSRRYPVGVDVERVRSIEIDNISGRYFTPDEQRLLAISPSGGLTRLDAFFQVWTPRKPT